jgi:hypothetical protein
MPEEQALVRLTEPECRIDALLLQLIVHVQR